MKRIIYFITTIAITLYSFLGATAPVFADETAVTAGRLLYTDISVYINHYPIPSYASDEGYMVVKLRDLEHYGFEVSWNEETRTAELDKKSPDENGVVQIEGIRDVKLPHQKTGIMFAKYIKNDINVIFEGESIPVYVANDSSYICIEELSRIGQVIWCPDIKASKIWIDGYSMIDYSTLDTSPLESKPYISDYNKYYNYDSSIQNWWFRKSPGSSEIDESVIPIISGHKVVFRDTLRPKKIYLTFDEGYEAGYTKQIIDVLNKYNIPAAFFITGDYLNDSADLVQLMLEYGYTVGNHTVKHPNLPSLSPQNAAYQISELNNRFADMFGENMEYMRPPEGSYSKRILALADDMGYKTVFWSFAYSDWDTSNQKGADHAFNQITPYLHDGAVMLLHACSSDNANVLDRLIQYIIDQGYTFGSLDEIYV